MKEIFDRSRAIRLRMGECWQKLPAQLKLAVTYVVTIIISVWALTEWSPIGIIAIVAILLAALMAACTVAAAAIAAEWVVRLLLLQMSVRRKRRKLMGRSVPKPAQAKRQQLSAGQLTGSTRWAGPSCRKRGTGSLIRRLFSRF